MLTRRSLLKSATAAAVSATLARRSFAASAAPGSAPLRQLDYSAVALLPGPLAEQFRYHHQLLLAIDNDALLKPFRERSGQPAPGDDLGGWYSNSPFFDPHGSFDGFVPGHSLGQWISALARASAITGDRATQVKVDALVTGLAPAVTSRFYDGYTLPAYTFDKTCCGLIDAYSLAGVKAAKPALEHALAVTLPHLPEKALSRPEQAARPHSNDAQTWDETYTLPENLFLAYGRMGGNPAFRDAAVRFLEDDVYFGPLSEGIDVLPGKHAYSHVNALSSAMQAYLMLGSEKHLRAATNAFRMVEAQSFATGGWGPGETLLRPGTDDLARSLFTQPASFETPCGAYAHFKITRYLLRVTGDARYGDSMERVLYNTVLGARPLLPDGSSFYYADFTLSGRRTYARDRWPCCSGTLPQVAADYGISSYLGGVPGGANGLTVVLFVPSKVTFSHAGQPVAVTQQTGYPAVPETTLTVETAREAAFPLAIRIPAWAGLATRVRINGKAASGELKPGSFFRIERSWRSGDRVEVSFDVPLRTETLAAVRGHVTETTPTVSAPLNSASGANTDPLARRQPPAPTRLAALMRGPVVFMATGMRPTAMREKELLAGEVATAGDTLTVRPAGADAVHFVPFPAVGDATYRTYQPLVED